MNVDELNAKYDEIYNKNIEIQQLLSEVDDYSDILFFLYDTEIKKPNVVLNTMIDNYEGLIFKIREAHKEIKASLYDFGDENDLAEGVKANEDLTDKIKDLILWKLRRLFMVYDEEPVLPYIEGEFLTAELIGEPKTVPAPDTEEETNEDEDTTIEIEEESKISPEGGVFPDQN